MISRRQFVTGTLATFGLGGSLSFLTSCASSTPGTATELFQVVQRFPQVLVPGSVRIPISLANQAGLLGKTSGVELPTELRAQLLNSETGEVVIAEVSKWLHDAGLNPKSTSITRAGVALGASIAIGSILRSYVTGSNPGMRMIVDGIHNAYLVAKPTSKPRKTVAPKPIRSATGSPLRDALIDATAEVMSKTGFTGATISRIARKSGVTSGSIYNFYPDKEALMNDAVSELMRTTQRQNLDSKRTASSAKEPNFGLTDSFDFGLIPDRRTWLRFRQECLIATRHHKKTHSEMKKVVLELDAAMKASFPKVDQAIITLVSMGEQAIGYGYSSLFGYTDLFSKCDFDAIMVQVAKQNNL